MPAFNRGELFAKVLQKIPGYWYVPLRLSRLLSYRLFNKTPNSNEIAPHQYPTPGTTHIQLLKRFELLFSEYRSSTFQRNLGWINRFFGCSSAGKYLGRNKSQLYSRKLRGKQQKSGENHQRFPDNQFLKQLAARAGYLECTIFRCILNHGYPGIR